MSDIAETEPKIDFEHYVVATLQICEEFRDVLVEHTDEQSQAAVRPMCRSTKRMCTGCGWLWTISSTA
jgi:hypothetical protein